MTVLFAVLNSHAIPVRRIAPCRLDEWRSDGQVSQATEDVDPTLAAVQAVARAYQFAFGFNNRVIDRLAW